MNRNAISIILIALAAAITLVLIVCLIRFVVTKHLEKSTAAYQNKLLKNQIDEVHNVYMTMRGWRHDYHTWAVASMFADGECRGTLYEYWTCST